MLNSVEVKDFRIKDLSRKLHNDKMRGADKIGVNAMSISEITGIPRPTVVRKLKYLIQNDYLKIKNWIEPMYSTQRIKLDLKGLLLIGY